MRVLAQYKYGSNIIMTTPTTLVQKVSPDSSKPEIVVKQDTISYSAGLSDSGLILQEEPALSYTLS